MLIIERPLKAIRSAVVYNPDVQVEPSSILRPDSDRQWEPVRPTLRAELPKFFILDNYEENKQIDPTTWLRCLITHRVPDGDLPAESTPRTGASCKTNTSDKDYFNTLLTGAEPVRYLLRWLEQNHAFRSFGENEWRAFAEVCKSEDEKRLLINE